MTNILFTRTTDAQSKVLKMMLKKKGIEFEERNIDSGRFSRADVKALAPDAMQIPILIMDEVVIGGLNETHEHFKALAAAPEARINQQAALAAMPKFGRQAKA